MSRKHTLLMTACLVSMMAETAGAKAAEKVSNMVGGLEKQI